MTRDNSTAGNRLSFGWFIPTHGDRSTFGAHAKVDSSLDQFERVAKAAEEAGFEYALVPVGKDCWDAWVVSTYLAARTQSLKFLVALKPGYIHPVALAKMVSTFDMISGGDRCYINLIAGASVADATADGQIESKEARYEQLAEATLLLKRLATEDAVEFEGKYYQVRRPVILPKPRRCPPLYLGGGSEFAADLSARYSSTHLFWGDYPERIATQVKEMRERAAKYGREQELKFGMRLQIICRETEKEAWEYADQLVGNSDARKGKLLNDRSGFNSAADERQRELSKLDGHKLSAHLWSGISEVRAGAGVAVVGNPLQVASQLREFVDAGCTSFCLSGFPHDEEARIFGRHVMPLLA